MKLLAILNESAGTLLGKSLESVTGEIRSLCERAGIEVRVVVAAGSSIRTAVRAALETDIDVLAIGGGDGTISIAAGLMADSGRTLGLLPLGTVNLLAHDLGLPQDLPGAIRVLAGGVTRRIDVAEVNGHVFLNNAVLGLYPSLVRARERQRGVPGWRKWPALLLAVARTIRYYNLLELEIDLGQGPQRVQTQALAVVNNPYQPRAFFTRSRLDGGRLGVYVARHRTMFGLLRLLVRLALGGWHSDDELQCLSMSHLAVTSPTRRRLKVSCDGEVLRMVPPLHFRIRPGALRVLVPASSEPS